jgi:hypothetical protein
MLIEPTGKALGRRCAVPMARPLSEQDLARIHPVCREIAMKPNAILLLALSLPSPVLAASAYTLCHTNETVVFSCATGTHFLSICASPNLSKEAGYLQYRYGSKDKLELVYPTTPQPPTGLFVPFEQMYSGGFGSFVQFKNNNYTYTVFDAVGRWGKSCFTPHERAETCLQEVEGIAVQNNGKEVANIPCRKDANFVGGELGSSFWDKVGLKDLKDDDIQPEFEIPQAFFRN